jgi:PAS domain S-box-containing protein
LPLDNLQTPSPTDDGGFDARKVRQILHDIQTTVNVAVGLLDPEGIPAEFNESGALSRSPGEPVLAGGVPHVSPESPKPLLCCGAAGGLAALVPLHAAGRVVGFVAASGFCLAPLGPEDAEGLGRRLVVSCSIADQPAGAPCAVLDFEKFSVLVDLLQAGAARIALLAASPSKDGALHDGSPPISPELITALGELSSAGAGGAIAVDDAGMRERLEAIYNSTQDAILMLDKDLRIVAANKEFGRIFGSSADAFIGVTGVWLQRWIIKNAKDPVRVSTMIDELLGNPKAVLDDEIELLSPHYMILRFYSAPVSDKAGAIIGRLFVFRDITKFRKARYELIGSEKMNLIGRVAAGMAHELNNILAGMVAYADYALEEGDSDKIREALKMSISAAEKASELVQEFLTVAGPSESQRQDVDLHLEVGRLLDSMEPRFRKDNIRLHRQLEGVPRVHADPVQILQTLRHLLDNAAEAIRKDGTISVKTETDWDRGNVRVVVADSGPGIPVEYLDRVFDPFFTTKGVVSGGGSTGAKGLGLSVAKGIVEAHGGKIYAGNVLPHGASIVVELPVAGGGAEKPPSPSIY